VVNADAPDVLVFLDGDYSDGLLSSNSDTPHLPTLQAAFRLLEKCDLVVGPTHDGGYYLVGARMTSGFVQH
jgi:glycosyltransferase A (GT-A) superfamily protein (DUF2064 family)